MRPKAVLLLTIAVAATGAACAAPNEIEGYLLGEPAHCAPICRQFTDYAATWLDDKAPGHSPIASADLWTLDHTFYLRSGSRGDYIVVLHLENGTARAILVGCGVGIDPDRCFTLPAADLP